MLTLKFKTMSSRIKLLIVSFVFLTISGLLIFQAILPILGSIKIHSRILRETKRDLAGFIEKSQLLPSVREDYAVLKPNLEMINNLFVDIQAPVSFLNSLEKTAQSARLPIEVSLLTAKAPAKDADQAEKAASMSFKVILIGSFSDCWRFLDKMENLPYLITIENLGLRRLTETQLKTAKYAQYSLGDVELALVLEVAADQITSSLGVLGPGL